MYKLHVVNHDHYLMICVLGCMYLSPTGCLGRTLYKALVMAVLHDKMTEGSSNKAVRVIPHMPLFTFLKN